MLSREAFHVRPIVVREVEATLRLLGEDGAIVSRFSTVMWTWPTENAELAAGTKQSIPTKAA